MLQRWRGTLSICAGLLAERRCHVSHTLLICSVGGSPEPIVAALKHWRPSRALFVPSRQTRPEIESKIIPLARQEGFDLLVGCYDFLEVPDSQDLAACIRKMRDLVPETARWLSRGPDYEVVVDYTGGTKTMSAALALQAHAWGCRFTYVGGTERTKNDVGIVVSGKEQVLHFQNPWEALGCQAVADAGTLFDQAAYGAAGKLLQGALTRVQDPARKRELNALRTLAEAYDAWDRFQHRDALRLLGDVLKYENDLRSLLGPERTETLARQILAHRTYLEELLTDEGATRARAIDLLANAYRRFHEQRLDDAVARLYRAVEALAQARLRTVHGIADTGDVPLERLPEPLRTEKAVSCTEGTVKLALQEDYAVLHVLGDELGQRFQESGLADRERSPLQARNRSILAHGFAPVSEKDFQNLWQAALRLAAIETSHLPAFPRLGPA
jgi:CRISPR-associated protein (TIGR02710 family)